MQDKVVTINLPAMTATRVLDETLAAYREGLRVLLQCKRDDESIHIACKQFILIHDEIKKMRQESLQPTLMGDDCPTFAKQDPLRVLAQMGKGLMGGER